MTSTLRNIEVVVKSVRTETPEINSFVLALPDGGDLPAFEPGAHIDVEPVPGLVRQYSLAGDPGCRAHYLLGVKKEPFSRGGSSAMHGAIHEGSVLKISPPKNHFTLQPSAGRRLLLGGGIGITPLLSMAAALHRQGAEFQLHYFIRSNNDLAFRALFAEAGWTGRVVYHFGLVPPVLTDLLGDLLTAPGDQDHIYMCGPSPFMDTIRDVAQRAGWQDDHILCEHFSATPPQLSPEGDAFALRLASDGRELLVPSDKTIIEVLRENGVQIETSCEQGICGTCVTRCLEGDPDHRDLYLTDEERETERLFTPCVSRAKSKYLVLDI